MNVDTSRRLIIDVGWVISLLALIVGGIGVTNTMAMSVFERVREIGILRAVGWPGRRIAALIVSEALGSRSSRSRSGSASACSPPHLFTAQTGLSGARVARRSPPACSAGASRSRSASASLGAAYPAWRALRLSPIEALRRE